jgi:hypothetical protein
MVNLEARMVMNSKKHANDNQNTHFYHSSKKKNRIRLKSERIKKNTRIFYPCRQNITRRMSSFGNLEEWSKILERFNLNSVTTIDMLCFAYLVI